MIDLDSGVIVVRTLHNLNTALTKESTNILNSMSVDYWDLNAESDEEYSASELKFRNKLLTISKDLIVNGNGSVVEHFDPNKNNIVFVVSHDQFVANDYYVNKMREIDISDIGIYLHRENGHNNYVYCTL